jgi:hypothetical protein
LRLANKIFSIAIPPKFCYRLLESPDVSEETVEPQYELAIKISSYVELGLYLRGTDLASALREWLPASTENQHCTVHDLLVPGSAPSVEQRANHFAAEKKADAWLTAWLLEVIGFWTSDEEVRAEHGLPLLDADTSWMRDQQRRVDSTPLDFGTAWKQYSRDIRAIDEHLGPIEILPVSPPNQAFSKYEEIQAQPQGIETLRRCLVRSLYQDPGKAATVAAEIGYFPSVTVELARELLRALNLASKKLKPQILAASQNKDHLELWSALRDASLEHAGSETWANWLPWRTEMREHLKRVRSFAGTLEKQWEQKLKPDKSKDAVEQGHNLFNLLVEEEGRMRATRERSKTEDK